MPLRITGNIFVCYDGCRKILPLKMRSRYDKTRCASCLDTLVDEWYYRPRQSSPTPTELVEPLVFSGGELWSNRGLTSVELSKIGT